MKLHRTRSCGRWLLCGTLAGSLVSLDLAAAADSQKRVLVLYATRRDAQIVNIGERELPRILQNGLQEGLDYYSEYIDRARFADPLPQSAFRDFLRLKYRDVQFDVLVAMDEEALEFVVRNRDQLFQRVPVVFFAHTSRARPFEDSTGVIADLNLAGTVTLAADLDPNLRHVFVVSGANVADRHYEELARSQLKPFESRFAFTYLTGLATADLEARLGTLPEHSAVYYILVDQDGTGATFHPLEYLERLAARSNAPVYCWVDSAMNRGIVGGHLKSQTAEVDAVAALALRVLQGESAVSIPVESLDLSRNQVDWRQTRRWGISESRIPAGTDVLFRVPSIWERYKVYIIGSVALLVAQTLLIAGLLIQRRRRRQAEEQVRGSQTELRTSYERIRRLGSRLLNAQESERARIARELHDDVSQQVALLSIDLELLGAHTPSDKLAGEALNRAQIIAKSVHDLSHRLHPARLRLIGLVAAIQGLRQELSQSGVAVQFVHDGIPTPLPPEVTLCLFRIAQESLQNAVKYSGASSVSVDLHGGPGSLKLSISDSGVGFDVKSMWGKGLGLISMDERIEAIGGTFEIHSAPGLGTRVEVVIPLAADVHADKSTLADFA